MIGEKGIITTDVYGMKPKLYKKDKPTISGISLIDNSDEAEWGHSRKWIDACKDGFNSKKHQSLTSSFDYAGPLTETVLMGNIAIKSYLLRKETKNGGMDYYARKKLLWDGDNMKITNMEEANQFVGRDYRAGWEI